MSRVRAIGFCVATSLILCCVIAHFALGAVGAVEFVEDSSLEGRTYQQFPTLTLGSVARGRAQGEFEKYVADHVPIRSAVMLAHAGSERELIKFANLPFGFIGYSTFYGSEYAHLPAYGLTIEKPQKVASVPFGNLDRAVRKYSRLIDEHPDQHWVFCMPDRSTTTAASPLYDHVTNKADYDYYRHAILDKLPEACDIVDAAYADTDAFLHDYFHTDHHWQIEGALSAYRSIMRAFGREPVDFGDAEVMFDGPWRGSNARSGLCMEGAGDVLRDVKRERGHLSVMLGKKVKDQSTIDEGYGEQPEQFKLTGEYGSAYAQWFHHAEKKLITITNDNVKEGSILVIGDSFANSLDGLLAETYHTVWHIDPRYDRVDVDKFLAKHEIDDALIVLNQSFIVSNSVLNNL